MLRQPSLWQPTTDWTPPALGTLPSWKGLSRVAIDIETSDPSLKELGPGVRRSGFIVGVAFAIEDGPAFYLPMRHAGGNLPEEQVLAYLRDQARDFRGVLCGANMNYDLDYLAQAGVEFNPAWHADVQVADPLLNELQKSYSLAAISERWGLPGKTTAELEATAKSLGLNNAFTNMHNMHAGFVANYAMQDARLPLQLLKLQEEEIRKQDLMDIYRIESKLIPVLLKMRRRGVRVDLHKIDEIERWATAQQQDQFEIVKNKTGIQIGESDLWSAEALLPVVQYLGITPQMTATGKPSISADLLDSIDHPAAQAVARARKMDKIKSTFIKSIRSHQTHGRIHCTMNQLRRTDDADLTGGTVSGRLSSEHPNMQQQPARDPELGPLWRSIYLPEEGKLWCSADFSQQEPRWIVHYAELLNCKNADIAGNQYRNDPSTDFHNMAAQMTGLPRKQAKNIFLGFCYGMGGAKLCKQLGLPTRASSDGRYGPEVAGEEGQRLMLQFNHRMPFVRQLAKLCQQRAEERGFIRTAGGRLCRFEKDHTGKVQWTHKALNRLIQGSSADQTKLAMVLAEAAGFELQLQVHDELDLSVNSREEAQELARIMCSAMPMRVPSKVDLEFGPNWGEIE